MGRARKKPDFDPNDIMERIINNISDSYGELYDDRNNNRKSDISLRRIAEEYDISILKTRKILITAGKYSTSISRLIQQYISEGKTTKEIVELTRLSRASVHSYIPYTKIVYNLDEISVEAERKKHQRERSLLCKYFVEKIPFMSQNEAEEELLKVMEQLQGCIFVTADNKRFRYKLCGDELLVDRETDGINKTTIYDAFHKLIGLKEVDKNSGGLAANVNPYLYAIFKRIGILEREEV